MFFELAAQDRGAGLGVRRRHVDAALEPARPQQRRVDQLRPVRRAQDDDLAHRLDAVELGQQRRDHTVGDARVRRLPAARGQRVDLVQEDQGRRGLRGAAEQLPHRTFRLADPLVHQLGALDREHVQRAGAGQRPHQERLATTGRAVEQHAARRFDTEARERVRVPQRPQHGLGERLLDVDHVPDVVQGQPAGGQVVRSGHRHRPDGGQRVQQVLLARSAARPPHAGAAPLAAPRPAAARSGRPRRTPASSRRGHRSRCPSRAGRRGAARSAARGGSSRPAAPGRAHGPAGRRRAAAGRPTPRGPSSRPRRTAPGAGPPAAPPAPPSPPAAEWPRAAARRRR